MQTYLFPTSQLDVDVDLLCEFSCLLLKWSFLFVPQAQSWTLSRPIIRHHFTPGFSKYADLQRFKGKPRAVLQWENCSYGDEAPRHRAAAETGGSVHLPPGHRPAALQPAAAPPSPPREHNSCPLKQRIKSSLGGKPRYKACLQWLIRVLSTGKTEPHLIHKLSFWLSIIKTIVAMAIQRPGKIYARLMSCLLGDTICRPSLVCARTEQNVTREIVGLTRFVI